MVAEQFGIPVLSASAKLGIGVKEAFAYLVRAQENKTIKKDKKAKYCCCCVTCQDCTPSSFIPTASVTVSCMIDSSVTFHDSYLIKTAIKTTTHLINLSQRKQSP
jgi:hypothetical protein